VERIGTPTLAISADYSTPVYVNGYQCNNCAQVAEAKQDINPADPKAGPWGIDAKSNQATGQAPAFLLGGSLARAAVTNSATSGQSLPPSSSSDRSASPAPPPPATNGPGSPGSLIDISA
jgi:hypothetical protein